MRNVTQNEDSLKNITANTKSAALISFLLVLPFAILEALNNTINRQNTLGLVVLFGLLWLLPVVFILILVPTVRKVPAGNGGTANSLGLLLRVALLVAVAMMWGGILIDQMPCFLGAPNCD